jgi:Ca2+-binding RTX toxin-like protein
LRANVFGDQGNDNFTVDFDNIYINLAQQSNHIPIYDMDDLSQLLQLSFDGGTGADSFDISSSTFGVSLNLESQIGKLANVQFNIKEFELVSTTEHDDEIYAGSNHVSVFAKGGDDQIHGNIEEDELYGGHGDDYLSGESHAIYSFSSAVNTRSSSSAVYPILGR